MLSSSCWLPCVLSHWSQSCGFRLLLTLCFLPVCPLHPLFHQPEGIVHFSCDLLGRCLGRGWVPQQGVLLGALAACRARSAACTGRWCSDTVLRWKEELQWVQLGSLMSIFYPCAVLQLACCLSFALNLSKKESLSYFVIMPSGIPCCLSLFSFLFFFYLLLNLLRKNSLTAWEVRMLRFPSWVLLILFVGSCSWSCCCLV